MVSRYAEIDYVGKVYLLRELACFQWNKHPTATPVGNSVFIVDSMACSKSDV
jgi:hypothetical protein